MSYISPYDKDAMWQLEQDNAKEILVDIGAEYDRRGGLPMNDPFGELLGAKPGERLIFSRFTEGR